MTTVSVCFPGNAKLSVQANAGTWTDIPGRSRALADERASVGQALLETDAVALNCDPAQELADELGRQAADSNNGTIANP